jgi:hypothetical protein
MVFLRLKPTLKSNDASHLSQLWPVATVQGFYEPCGSRIYNPAAYAKTSQPRQAVSSEPTHDRERKKLETPSRSLIGERLTNQ